MSRRDREYYKPKQALIGVVSSLKPQSRIDCFDKCLLKLGLGNVSIFKITSILPSHVKIVTKLSDKPPVGVNIPAVYAFTYSSGQQKRIAAGIGLVKTERATLVAEHTSNTEQEVRETVSADLQRMAQARNLEILERRIESTEIEVNGKGGSLAIVAEVA